MNATAIITKIAIIAIPLLFAITLHEAAHGWVASKLGDQTAKMLGRVTLNPIKHIDPLGTIIIPLAMLILSNFRFMFGWAKPVPVNWANLHHPRRDMALVAIAGPFANLLMAFIWAGIAKLTLMGQPESGLLAVIVQMGFYGILINCLLLVLNLIPVPPLDGSRVVSAVLPPPLARKYDLIEPYGIWIVLAALFLFGARILLPPTYALVRLISHLFGIST
jgi:Zn-dependent protease